MNQVLIDRIIALLAPNGYEARAQVESRYPARNLAPEAIVTRSAPSPTGFVHIGTIYMCQLNQFLAHQSGGVYYLRLEDTDKKREIIDGDKLIIDALATFDLLPDEGMQPDGSEKGAYGPYRQSGRQALYLSYAIELLKSGRAYPCFATAEELEANVKAQQAAKVRPGYYGEWALWRDKSDDEITAALDAGKPFVLRFKSMGSHQKRITFKDVLKGSLELPENDLDIPLIKSDEHRLPTYHLAHVVDDYLMKSNLILRGDEWLPSTPLHIELCQALGIEPFRYAHFAPISVQQNGSKRKLSKRKDPEADVQFWIKAGWPIPAIKMYLLGLASSSFEDWRKANPDAKVTDFPLSFEKLAKSRAPLLDPVKIADYAKDYIAALPQAEFEAAVLANLKEHQPEIAAVFEKDSGYTSSVLAIERSGAKPRKDMAQFGEAKELYGYFFDELFERDFAPTINQELEAVHTEDRKNIIEAFLATYNFADDATTWFEKVKQVAESTGYAANGKDFKANPDAYKGTVADVAKVLRVSLTGKSRTPDLWTIMQVMGEDRVRSRLAKAA